MIYDNISKECKFSNKAEQNGFENAVHLAIESYAKMSNQSYESVKSDIQNGNEVVKETIAMMVLIAGASK